MRVLYLMSPRAHSHDLGADFLLGGFYATLGIDNVFAVPESDSLHRPRETAECPVCRECPYDSDQDWPRKGHTAMDVMDGCDVLCIATQPGDHHMRAHEPLLRAWPRTKPVIACDLGDAFGVNNGDWYRSLAGRPLTAHFKRELPIGATWALPLPLMYPASRIPQAPVHKLVRVFYHASGHGDTLDGAGAVRRQIVDDLRRRMPYGDTLNVGLHTSRATNLLPVDYHTQMTEALVGISWNGFPYVQNWDCNRVWEQFAYAVCQVIESPRIQIPKPFVDGVHCVYALTPEAVGAAVESLIHEPQRALDIAKAGHAWFAQWHTSEARALYVARLVELLA
jgi:hypothetical protein